MSYTHPAQSIIPFGQNKVPVENEHIKRILLIGQSGHGKTTSAMKDFKGKIVYADGENNVPPEFSSREDILYLPFHDTSWVKKNFPAAPNVTKAFLGFLDFSGPVRQLTSEYLFVTDSLSWLADELNVYLTSITPKSKNTGEDNGHWYWREWAQYWSDLCSRIKRLQCSFVLTAHEHELLETDTGKLQGYRWWLPGKQFTPRLPQFFTDVFRQIRRQKGDAYEYVWQIMGTSQFPAAKTTMRVSKPEVPATWKSFEDYAVGKLTTTTTTK